MLIDDQLIRHPNLNFGVREVLVTNDATTEDADYVEMIDIANVLSNTEL
jgi:uncharacterized protein with ATP-grasp and redox domains